jgi:ABC-type multidrug transport system ATPase subunit
VPLTADRLESPNAIAGVTPVIEARDVHHRFEKKVALRDVSLVVEPGEIRALLGPNGAGKTTLLRVLAGLIHPTSGAARVLGLEAARSPRALRQRVGLIPAGDRSLYLRISGLENLVFFARLHGMTRRLAVARAHEVMDHVGLRDEARVPVSAYSHGMQKRLSIARALLTEPAVLLVDEATHDLDPEGARRVRQLVRDIARNGAGVVWATQRVEEIRGFADRVELLSGGEVRFSGPVADFISHSVPRCYLLRVRNGRRVTDGQTALQRAIAGLGTIAAVGGSDSESYVLTLAEEAVLGDAIASLSEAHMQVLACREERSEIEEAFLKLATNSSEGSE